jgi:hypothetical protein
MTMATTIRARIYVRGKVSFAKFIFLPSWFAKLLEANFSCFAKIIRMPSSFTKLLELLLNNWDKLFCQIFLQNGFWFTREYASPSQPQLELTQPQPQLCQTHP